MNNTSTLSQRSLIENAINGNRKSQKELYERLSPKMFEICLQYAKNRIDAEDILQNAFVKLFNTLHRFKGDEVFEEWAGKIFINTATKHIKKNKVNINIDEDLKNAITEEQIMHFEDLYENIYSKVSDKFRKDNRAVFKLYAVDGYAAKETIAGNNAKNSFSAKKSQKLEYTIQKGDDRRMDKDGVMRVYNLKEPIDIPVKKLLGKWKNTHIGVTLVFVNEKWHVEGEMIEHVIDRFETAPASGLKRLLKFV